MWTRLANTGRESSERRHRSSIEENGRVFDFALSDEDMAALDSLDETGGTERARESRWW